MPKPGKGGEVKTLDTLFQGNNTGVGYTVDTNPAMQLSCWDDPASHQIVNGVQQGTHIAARIGNKIKLKSMRIRLILNEKPDPGVSDLYFNSVRVLVLYDRQPNGAYNTNAQVLNSVGQTGSLGNNANTDSLNPTYFDRYVILMDKWMVTPPVAAVGTSITTATSIGPTAIESFKIDEYIKLKGLETVFSGTSSPMTIGNIQTGALIIMTKGTNPNNATTGWQLFGTCRLRFWDP